MPFRSSKKQKSERSPAPEVKFGLIELQANPEATVNVIAVHGLNGHLKRTWTHENGCMWLKDLLPEEVPSARIMTFGYDSQVFPSSSKGQNIEDFAQALLNGVMDNLDNSDCPTVFIAHSLGGIVVKMALNMAQSQSGTEGYQKVLKNTRAIAFLATPHSGSEATFSKCISQVLKVVGIATGERVLNRDLVHDLQSRSRVLYNTSTAFAHRLMDMTILSFYETRMLNGMLVVDKESATLCIGGAEQLRPVNANHSSICKVSGPESSEYGEVVKPIVNLLKRVATSQPNPSSLSQRVYYEVPDDDHLPFYGREKIFSRLEELRNLKNRTRLVILYGLLGQGKSRVAKELCRRRKLEDYQAIFWVDASRKSSVERRYDHLARIVLRDDSTNFMPSDTVRYLVSTMEQWQLPWLMVFDGYDDPHAFADLISYIPRSTRGEVIVTSRMGGPTAKFLTSLTKNIYRVCLEPDLDPCMNILQSQDDEKTAWRDIDDFHDAAFNCGENALVANQIADFAKTAYKTYVDAGRIMMKELPPTNSIAPGLFGTSTPWHYPDNRTETIENEFDIFSLLDDAYEASKRYMEDIKAEEKLLTTLSCFGHCDIHEFLFSQAFHLQIRQGTGTWLPDLDLEVKLLESKAHRKLDVSPSKQSILACKGSVESLLSIASRKVEDTTILNSVSTETARLLDWVPPKSYNVEHDVRKSHWQCKKLWANLEQLALMQVGEGYFQGSVSMSLNELVANWLRYKFRHDAGQNIVASAVLLSYLTNRFLFDKSFYGFEVWKVKGHLHTCIGQLENPMANLMGSFEGFRLHKDILVDFAACLDTFVVFLEDYEDYFLATRLAEMNMVFKLNSYGRSKRLSQVLAKIRDNQCSKTFYTNIVRDTIHALSQSSPEFDPDLILRSVNAVVRGYIRDHHFGLAIDLLKECQSLVTKSKRANSSHQVYNRRLICSIYSKTQQTDLYDNAIGLLQCSAPPGPTQPNPTITSLLWADFALDGFRRNKFRTVDSQLTNDYRTCSTQLGQFHPKTLEVVQYMALVYQASNRWKDASALLRGALKLALNYPRELKPQQSPQATRVAQLLGQLYARRGDLEMALKCMGFSYCGRLRKFGKANPFTISSALDLARIYTLQDRRIDALEFGHRASLHAKNVLGENHELFVIAQAFLAILHCRQIDYGLDATRVSKNQFEDKYNEVAHMLDAVVMTDDTIFWSDVVTRFRQAIKICGLKDKMNARRILISALEFAISTESVDFSDDSTAVSVDLTADDTDSDIGSDPYDSDAVSDMREAICEPYNFDTSELPESDGSHVTWEDLVNGRGELQDYRDSLKGKEWFKFRKPTLKSFLRSSSRESVASSSTHT